MTNLAVFDNVIEQLSSRYILHHHKDVRGGTDHLVPVQKQKHTLQVKNTHGTLTGKIIFILQYTSHFRNQIHRNTVFSCTALAGHWLTVWWCVGDGTTWDSEFLSWFFPPHPDSWSSVCWGSSLPLYDWSADGWRL